jgi:hypothetical protein
MGCQSGYVRSAAGDDGNTSGQNERGQIHNDHGQSHLENEDVQNDHCYKNHVQSHHGCKFHSFFFLSHEHGHNNKITNELLKTRVV